MNPLALVLLAIIAAACAVLLGLIVGLRILAAAIVEAVSYWKLPESDNVVPFSREKQHCDYPKCRCPIDPPVPCPTDWCARSLPKEHRS